MKKIVTNVMLFILLLLIIINLLSSFNLSIFGYRLFRVGSGSMEPTLMVNDLLLVKSSNDYQVDDIITYQVNNEYVTHRIYAIDNESIITKGDANNLVDDAISYDNIVGKVIYHFSFLGLLIYVLSRPIVLLLLFIIGLLVTILIPDKELKIDERNQKKTFKKEV